MTTAYTAKILAITPQKAQLFQSSPINQPPSFTFMSSRNPLSTSFSVTKSKTQTESISIGKNPRARTESPANYLSSDDDNDVSDGDEVSGNSDEEDQVSIEFGKKAGKAFERNAPKQLVIYERQVSKKDSKEEFLVDKVPESQYDDEFIRLNFITDNRGRNLDLSKKKDALKHATEKIAINLLRYLQTDSEREEVSHTDAELIKVAKRACKEYKCLKLAELCRKLLHHINKVLAEKENAEVKAKEEMKAMFALLEEQKAINQMVLQSSNESGSHIRQEQKERERTHVQFEQAKCLAEEALAAKEMAKKRKMEEKKASLHESYLRQIEEIEQEDSHFSDYDEE